MSGLYQRAMEFLRSHPHLRIVRSTDDEYGDFQGTPEERAQIEGEIERAVSENRLEVDPELFELKPRRRGSTLPILVNVAAVVLTAGGVYGLVHLFGSQEATLVSRTTAIVSTEGRLLSALREQSATQLSEKDAEISSIERRLADARSEQDRVRSDAQAQLQQRQTELQAQFDAALDAERSRLAAQNLSDDEQTAQLNEYRDQQLATMNATIDQLRSDSEATIASQQEALASAVNDFQSQLDAAHADRDSLQTRLATQEEQLRSQFASRETTLDNEREAAVQLLDQLQAQQEKRQLVLDQILAFYGQARDALAAGSNDQAQASLASLRDYLEKGPIATMPELQRRRQVELFLVGTLEERVSRAQSEASIDTKSLIETAGLVADVTGMVSRAESTLQSGDTSGARELYVAALSRIPAVKLGYERLEAIGAQAAASASQRVASAIEDGNAAYLRGDYQEAVRRYATALESLPSPDDRLLTRILDAGYRIKSADSLAEMTNLRNELTQRDATIASQKDETSNLRFQLTSVNDLLASERSHSADLETQLRTTTSLADDLRAKLAAAQGSVDSTEQRLAAANDSAEVAKRQLSASQTTVAALQARIADMQEIARSIAAYKQAFSQVPTTAPTETDQMQLLETKLLVLRILGSDSVRADYPDLYDRLNAYLDALVAEQRNEAARDTLSELGTMLDEVAARTDATIASVGDLTTDYPVLASTPDATDELLGKLGSISTPR